MAVLPVSYAQPVQPQSQPIDTQAENKSAVGAVQPAEQADKSSKNDSRDNGTGSGSSGNSAYTLRTSPEDQASAPPKPAPAPSTSGVQMTLVEISKSTPLPDAAPAQELPDLVAPEVEKPSRTEEQDNPLTKRTAALGYAEQMRINAAVDAAGPQEAPSQPISQPAQEIASIEDPFASVSGQGGGGSGQSLSKVA